MSALGPEFDSLFFAFQQAVAGRYSIEREIGRGGMGVVYLAKEVHLDRLVAIKLLPPDRASDPVLRERFLREARMAARLSHPNIVPIHSVDEGGEFVFYVMAYVDGGTLAQRVQQRGPVMGSEGSRIVRDVAFALAYAHENGLVHRDVKPDNILIESATGRVLVTDFGIAAALTDARGTGVTGTPEFMSPEQALGRDVDARSDLYSLGVTAFYAFSGRLPFEGRTPTEIVAKHAVEAPPSLAMLGLGVPKRIAALVDRCLTKEPEQRPQSAYAFAEQLGIAMERRRELPAALTAFVKRHGRLDGDGSFVYLGAVAGATMLADASLGPPAAWAVLGTGIVPIPLAMLVRSAGRLLQSGFSRTDLIPAYCAEIEQRREEVAIEAGSRARGMESVLATATKVSILAAGTGLLARLILLQHIAGGPGGEMLETCTQINGLPIDPRACVTIVTQTPWGYSGFLSALGFIGPVTYLAAAATIGLGVPWLLAVERRRELGTELWGKLWTGRAGKLLFALARPFVGKRARIAAMTHGPTELSLGLAASELFGSLPKQTRAELGDVPAVVRRLEHDAQQLRAKFDEIQDALATHTGSEADEPTLSLQATRDGFASRLRDAIGALETIRLNLLRLHAGAGNVSGFTTHLGAALDISDEIARLVAGRAEVTRFLSPFPRQAPATPA